MNHAPSSDAPAACTLVPYAKEERISVKEAATIAGKSERTLRNWCVERGIGRRVGGIWAVSKVALVMWLDGDLAALAAYRDRGARASSETVARYYRRCELASLLERPGFTA
jgi:helix-turn-helix protein